MHETIRGKLFTYSEIKPIGEGANGQIFNARQNSTNHPVVLKRIAKGRNKERIISEVSAGIKLNGTQGIPHFHEFFETDTDFYLVFDYIKGSDLFTRLSNEGMKPFSENQVRKIVKQLVDILRRIHEKGVSHRDVKLENIMISDADNSIYLIDFGLSFHYDNYDSCRDHSGTKEYAPPEVIQGQDSFSSTSADVWSLGVTVFTLMYGTFPFNYDRKEGKMRRTGDYPHPYFAPNSGGSKQSVDLLSKMLEEDPCKRVTIKEIEKHPFLKSNLFSTRFIRSSWI